MKVLIQRKIDIYTLHLREDGILQVDISAERIPTLEGLKKMIEIMGKMVQQKKTPVLIKRHEFSIPTPENRSFWAKQDTCPYASAEAHVITSLGHKLIANFYLRVDKPDRPTKMFSTEEDAVKWLKNFL